jgi:hypothetical protein
VKKVSELDKNKDEIDDGDYYSKIIVRVITTIIQLNSILVY